MLRTATVKKSAGSDWRDGFLFVGNHVILDFLNTCPVQNGERLELLPDFNEVLRWFLSARLVSSRQLEKLQQRWGASARAREFTATLGELREKIRDEILAWEQTGKLHHGMVDELNRIMTEHPMLTRLKQEATGSIRELWFEARRPEDLFAPLAHSAAELFSGADRSRVRKCGYCVLHFYDTSKKGTRRWCSMQLCGNRLKVAAYAARHRTRTHT
jgi:predicted RNA-binding Zn ribbon-like protein